jgi:hypothetical protein
MKSPDQVKALITAKLLAEQLPMEPPGVATTGTGSGEPCAACDEPIRVADVECMAEFLHPPALHFHIDCFTEWRRQQGPPL